MFFSKSFIKTKHENSSSATVYSHVMMLRAGMIDLSCAGIYNWLPLGLKVLRKIENLVRSAHNEANCSEMLIATLQPASVWEKSHRINSYGKELLRIVDRHESTLVYGPTAEDVVTDLFHRYCKSYKDLPKILYNIQWKFRDEIRPRHGLMRGREFLMSDAYSFDIDEESAIDSYKKMFNLFTGVFKQIGLPYLPVKADAGVIGGEYTHEFHLIAENGESEIFMKKGFEDYINKYDFDLNDIDDGDFISDEKIAGIADVQDKYISFRSIEVGHNFYFNTKYTEIMGCYLQNSSGERFFARGGSYGIGVSRLAAAIIEASHDEKGVLWPRLINPFEIILINVHSHDAATHKYGCNIYDKLREKNIDVGYDDRDISYGQKIQDAYLIGACYIIIFGKNDINDGNLRVISRLPKNTQENFDKVMNIEEIFYLF